MTDTPVLTLRSDTLEGLMDRLVKTIWTRCEIRPDDPAEYQDFAMQEVTAARDALKAYVAALREESETCAGIVLYHPHSTVQLRKEIAALRSSSLTSEEARKTLDVLAEPEEDIGWTILGKLKRISSLPD